ARMHPWIATRVRNRFAAMTDPRGASPNSTSRSERAAGAAPFPSGARLAGCRVVVTGAASGIGAVLARRFAREAEVLLVDREAEAVRELARELGAEARVVDLSVPDEVAGLGEGADIVLNNAGFQHVAPVPEFDPETFDEMLRVVVASAFRIVRSALPAMYERGWGRVINISSVHGA